MAGSVRSDKVQIDVEINGDPVIKTLADMEKHYAKLRKEIKHGEDVGTESFKKKAKELKEFEEKLKEARKAARGMADEQENLGKKGKFSFSQLSDRASKLPGVFGKVGGAIGGSISKLLGPLGLVITGITGIVAGAKELFVMSQEFENAREEVSKFTDLTGEGLSEVNAQIMAISRTFEQDFNEVLRTGSANANVFGTEMTETLDLIEKGLLATGHQGQEFLDQIKEYAPALKAAGLEQEEAYAVIASGIVDGAFQDKIPDAIKEFNVRIKDLTNGQREVLEKSFGVDFTNNIVNGIKTGEKTSIEALNEIGGKMGELGADSAETQAVISNLFGGPGEDVGADFIIGLQNIKGSMDEVVDTSNIYIQRQIEQLEVEKELTAAQEEISMSLSGVGHWFGVVTKRVKTFILQGIARASTSIRYLVDNFKIFRVQAAESINVVLRALSNLVNNLINTINAVNGLLGIKEIENIDLTIDVEVSSEDLKQQLQDKVAKQREDFEKAQEIKRKQAAQRQEQATRSTRLKERQNTLDAERNLTTKELKKQAEVYAKAEMEINKLMVDLMQEGEEKQIAQLRLQTDQKKAALKGSVEQIAAQQKLLEAQYLEQLEVIRNQSADKELEDIKAQAQAKIDALTGTSEEIQAQRLQIELDAGKQINDTVNQNLDEQIQLIKDQAAARKQIIIGDSETITAEMEAQIKESEQRMTNEITQIQTSAKAKQAAAMADIRKSSADSQQKQFDDELNQIQQRYEQEELFAIQNAIKRLEDGEDQKEVQEQLNEDLKKLDEKHLNEKKQLEDRFGADSVATQQEIEKMKLDASLERIEKEKEAEQKSLEEKRAQVETTLGNIGSFISEISALNQASLDADLAKIDANKKRELDAAGDNEAKKRSIEEKYEKKKEAAEKKAAKRQQTISIAQTIINTAQSIIKTGAQLGYPAAIPFQVIAAAIGAKQIQAIRAQAFEEGGATVQTDGKNYFYQGQKLNQRGSFATGGHVRQGSIGVIGEKGAEWVAPNWMMTSTKYSPIIQELEKVRVRGFAVGGATTPADTAVNVQNATASNDAIIAELKLLRQDMATMKYITVWGEKEALMNAEVYDAWQQRSSTGGI